MFSSDRTELRQVFYDVWQLRQQNKPLDALQQIIVSIIEQHPEYHPLLEQQDFIDKDFDETNPFLHMSMHIALIEQISTNRPAGIRELYQSLTADEQSAHEAEHRMMDCLSEAIWQAQRNNTAPDETAYFECLKKISLKS